MRRRDQEVLGSIFLPIVASNLYISTLYRKLDVFFRQNHGGEIIFQMIPENRHYKPLVWQGNKNSHFLTALVVQHLSKIENNPSSNPLSYFKHNYFVKEFIGTINKESKLYCGTRFT